MPPCAPFGSNLVGLGGAASVAGGAEAYRAGAIATAPCTGTANATLAESAAATIVTTWGDSTGVSGCGSSGSGCVSGFGCSSGGVKTTGTVSTTSLSCRTTTLGDLSPTIPITKNKKQIEFTHASVRYWSLYSAGRLRRAKSEDKEYFCAEGPNAAATEGLSAEEPLI